MNSELKKYYDRIQPSPGLRDSTLKKIRDERRRKRKRIYVLECLGSLAASLAVVIAIDRMKTNPSIPVSAPFSGSVFSDLSGIVIGGCLFVILFTVFTLLFKHGKSKDGNLGK